MNHTYLIENGKLYKSSRNGFVCVGGFPHYMESLPAVVEWHERQLKRRRMKRCAA